MKNLKLAVLLVLLSTISGYAQGFNNQRGNGVNRDLTGGYANSPSKPSAEDIEKNRIARIEKFVSQLKQELTLDDLQVIAIRNEIASNSKNVDIVMKKENSEEQKSKEVKALMEQAEARINSYLNNQQKEKFKEFTANSKNIKKEKKEKKSKKEATPTEE